MRDEPVLQFRDVVRESSIDGAIIIISSRGIFCSWCGEPIYTTSASPKTHLTAVRRDGRIQIGCGTTYKAISIVGLDQNWADMLAGTTFGKALPIVELTKAQTKRISMELKLDQNT